MSLREGEFLQCEKKQPNGLCYSSWCKSWVRPEVCLQFGPSSSFLQYLFGIMIKEVVWSIGKVELFLLSHQLSVWPSFHGSPSIRPRVHSLAGIQSAAGCLMGQSFSREGFGRGLRSAALTSASCPWSHLSCVTYYAWPWTLMVHTLSWGLTAHLTLALTHPYSPAQPFQDISDPSLPHQLQPISPPRELCPVLVCPQGDAQCPAPGWGSGTGWAARPWPESLWLISSSFREGSQCYFSLLHVDLLGTWQQKVHKFTGKSDLVASEHKLTSTDSISFYIHHAISTHPAQQPWCVLTKQELWWSYI